MTSASTDPRAHLEQLIAQSRRVPTAFAYGSQSRDAQKAWLDGFDTAARLSAEALALVLGPRVAQPGAQEIVLARELVIRADSFLSLLWHRYVPWNRKPTDLAIDVERTIGDLRKASVSQAGQETAPLPDLCVWSLDVDPDCESWDTTCGEKYQFFEGGPRDNGMRFCCYCGKTLTTAPPAALGHAGSDTPTTTAQTKT